MTEEKQSRKKKSNGLELTAEDTEMLKMISNVLDANNLHYVTPSQVHEIMPIQVIIRVGRGVYNDLAGVSGFYKKLAEVYSTISEGLKSRERSAEFVRHDTIEVINIKRKEQEQ